ncbi:MAG: AraC family transcriptional regulator [Ruminococcaceae bacterium]|nr:AraC family transcriptional regulator [Oscillospiraceae bacterium]
MFYELKHSIEADYWTMEDGRDLTFPLHIHACYEFFLVTEGELEMTIDGVTRTMGRGEGAIVFPYQMHGMHTECRSAHTLCVCSATLVGYFHRQVQGRLPEDNFFRLPEPLAELFAGLHPDSDILSVKGVLYLICGEFAKTAVYRPGTGIAPDQLLLRILTYIEENFSGSCSLRELAQTMSYDYSYLSKYFIRKIGFSFHDYVNERRLSNACYLLTNTERSMLEISQECGYNSLRSFNRNFKERFGISPTEYCKKDK